MQKVLNALRKLGIEATDTPELREQVTAFCNGQDPDSLTAPQAVQVAEAIAAAMGNSGLSVASSSQPAESKRGKAAKRDTRENRTPDIVEALKLAMGASANEVQSGLVLPIKGYADKFSTDAANEALDAIAEIPNETLTKFAALAMEHRGNPEFFRSRVEAALSGIGIDLSVLSSDSVAP